MIPWALLYHRATVVFGRTERAFWRMTLAQLVALADVHWPATTSSTPAPAMAERGTAEDLFALARMQH